MKYSTSILVHLAVAALFAAALLACDNVVEEAPAGTGGGGDSAMGPTPDAQIAKFCSATVAHLCQAYGACCSDTTSVDAGEAIDGCGALGGYECTEHLRDTILPQLEAGNTVLDEARLAACVSHLVSVKAGSATCVEPPLFVFDFDCLAAFQGTIPAGGACDVSRLPNSQFIPCQDGLCDNGKCNTFLATGAACDPSQNNSPAVCNITKDEWCIGIGTKGECGPRGKVGDACGAPGQDRVLACKSMSCGPDGKCIAPTASGVCENF